MKFLILISTIYLASCGKNTTDSPLTTPFKSPTPESKTEIVPTPKEFLLKEETLNLTFPLEKTQVTIEITPQFQFQPQYEVSKTYLPVAEYISDRFSVVVQPRPDIACPVFRKIYQKHISQDISSDVIKLTDLEIHFNGEVIAPTIVSEFPLIIALDFYTIEGKRELTIINKTISPTLRVIDDKTECDIVRQANPRLQFQPHYSTPTETVDMKSYKSFKIKLEE